MDMTFTLHPGDNLQGGKYRIEKVLGQGGFGITYLAIQGGLERTVAIKEFFMREACMSPVVRCPIGLDAREPSLSPRPRAISVRWPTP